MAIGGGTVIDMAKSINVFQAHDNQHKLLNLAMGKVTVTQTGLPLIAVPTTAGSGSEATHFAVIYVGDTKYSLAHSTMLPNYAIVDSRLTHGQPAYLTACTGFDALCQAVESYWANGATDKSQQYAHRAMTIILDNIKCAVHRPRASVRASMATAANLSGKAINISKTTGPHALSYGLTRNYGVPHGHAVALMMLRFLKLHADIPKNPDWVQHPKGVNYVNETMNQLFACMGVDTSKAAAACWENLMGDCSLTMRLQELGVNTSDDVDVLIENINFQRLSNHPIAVSQKIVRSFF